MARTTGDIASTGERMVPDALWTDRAGEWRWIDSVRHARAAHPPETMLLSAHSVLFHSQAVRMVEGDTIDHSLVNFFVARIAGLSEVERVFWKAQHSRIRVWTVMDRPNVAIENQIYDAQLDFMDVFPEISFDFVVIFRQGKNQEQISPEGATEVFVRK